MNYIPLKAKKSLIWLTCQSLYSSLKIYRLLLSSRLSASTLLQGLKAARMRITMAQVNTDKFITKAIKTTKKAREVIGPRLDTVINETKTIRIMLDSQEEIRHNQANRVEVAVKIINAAKIIRTQIKRAEKTIKITIRLRVMKRAKEMNLRCDMFRSIPKTWV